LTRTQINACSSVGAAKTIISRLECTILITCSIPLSRPEYQWNRIRIKLMMVSLSDQFYKQLILNYLLTDINSIVSIYLIYNDVTVYQLMSISDQLKNCLADVLDSQLHFSLVI
uniref:ACT domain-containing protein n=1 Tax=Schistosoma curassoni TaxID=6186 RepID=A0A183JSL8_9TREM